jgi:ectoine hydroxylase-related dioxygenase (phytanoyl-CoA dioxygenase family)
MPSLLSEKKTPPAIRSGPVRGNHAGKRNKGETEGVSIARRAENGKEKRMTPDDFRNYAANGYHVERGLFSESEAAEMIDHYMKLRAEGPKPGDFAGVKTRTALDAPDPLNDFPRFIQMHNWDERTRSWMSDPRLVSVVSALMGQTPELMQTMLYFKPPGSRGQSFHQDNLYLRITPVVASWTALDRCDAENGAMEMVRGSHLLGLLPQEQADTDVSFTDNQTVIPPYLPRDMIALEPGDTVFFHGLTIHGSMPNRTADRFRRSFICHYQGEITYPLGAPAPYPPATVAPEKSAPSKKKSERAA